MQQYKTSAMIFVEYDMLQATNDNERIRPCVTLMD